MKPKDQALPPHEKPSNATVVDPQPEVKEEKKQAVPESTEEKKQDVSEKAESIDPDFEEAKESVGNIETKKDIREISSVKSRQLNAKICSESGEGHVSPAYHLPKGGAASSPRLGPLVDANTPGTLRKLALFGKSTNKRLFEYPANLDSLVETGEQLKLADHVLQVVTCGIFDAVGSIMLHFGNGKETPQFGTGSGQQLKCSLEVPHGENINRIRVRHKASPASI